MSSGRRRWRWPVRAARALASAGAKELTTGSPRPCGRSSSFGTRWVSIARGDSPKVAIRNLSKFSSRARPPLESRLPQHVGERPEDSALDLLGDAVGIDHDAAVDRDDNPFDGEGELAPTGSSRGAPPRPRAQRRSRCGRRPRRSRAPAPPAAAAPSRRRVGGGLENPPQALAIDARAPLLGDRRNGGVAGPEQLAAELSGSFPAAWATSSRKLSRAKTEEGAKTARQGPIGTGASTTR